MPLSDSNTVIASHLMGQLLKLAITRLEGLKLTLQLICALPVSWAIPIVTERHRFLPHYSFKWFCASNPTRRDIIEDRATLRPTVAGSLEREIWQIAGLYVTLMVGASTVDEFTQMCASMSYGSPSTFATL